MNGKSPIADRIAKTDGCRRQSRLEERAFRMLILSVFFIASGTRNIHMKIKWQGFLPFPVGIGAIPKIRFQQGSGF